MACSICGKDVLPRGQNKSFPFCSPRCKQVDLGKWLNEDYRVPAEPSEDDDDENIAAAQRTQEPH